MLTSCLVRLPILAAFACATAPHPVHGAPGEPIPVIGPVIAPEGLDIAFDVEVGEPMMIAGQPQTAYIKITLGGFALPQGQRSPINLALVLDRSGSMSGDKLEKAKEAALMVIDRLQPDDIISRSSAYDTTGRRAAPAQKAGGERSACERSGAHRAARRRCLPASLHGLEEVTRTSIRSASTASSCSPTVRRTSGRARRTSSGGSARSRVGRESRSPRSASGLATTRT
jgi:Ca-activated chloride channel family protein